MPLLITKACANDAQHATIIKLAIIIILIPFFFFNCYLLFCVFTLDVLHVLTADVAIGTRCLPPAAIDLLLDAHLVVHNYCLDQCGAANCQYKSENHHNGLLSFFVILLLS